MMGNLILILPLADTTYPKPHIRASKFQIIVNVLGSVYTVCKVKHHVAKDLSAWCSHRIQWSPSNVDTLGTCIERCPHFRGKLPHIW